MSILLSDPRAAAIPVHPVEEPLVRLDATFGPARAPVRAGLAERLARAADALPTGAPAALYGPVEIAAAA
jgi:D-alanyl-D-alanine dipeptidase